MNALNTTESNRSSRRERREKSPMLVKEHAPDGTVTEREATRPERRGVSRFMASKAAKKERAVGPVDGWIEQYEMRGARVRTNLRKARKGYYSAQTNGAPTTTRQAQILNPAVLAPPTGSEGIAIGRDKLTHSLAAHDPFTAYQNKEITSPAVVVLGVIGSGKSSLVKTVYVLRPLLLQKRRVIVLDRKDEQGAGEYSDLVAKVRGDHYQYRIGGGGTRLNPLDPRIADVVGLDGQMRLLRAMLERANDSKPMTIEARTQLRWAHREVLRQAEQDGKVPVLDMMASNLGRMDYPELTGYSAAAKERSHQAGLRVRELLNESLSSELAGLFDGPTSSNVSLNAKLASHDISQLPVDGPATAMVVAVAQALLLGMLRTDRGHGTYFVVEEGWDMVNGPVAKQMAANQMLARGLGLANVAVMHHIAQVSKDSEAIALLREPQTVHLFRQDKATDIEEVVTMFGLDPQSADTLAKLEQGHHLMKIGGRPEIPIEHVRSELEKQLTHTDSAMLMDVTS